MYVYIRGSSYACQFNLRDSRGRLKRITHTLGKTSEITKTEAKRLGEKYRLQLIEDLNPTKKRNMSISALVNEYIHRSSGEYSLHTLTGYEILQKNYIDPTVGNVTLVSLDNIDLQNMISFMKRKGLSTKTMMNAKGLLTASVNYAVQNRYIDNAPLFHVRLPARHLPDIEIVTREQASLLFKYAKQYKIYLPLMTLFYTMMRTGEVCGLQFQDIDLDKGILHIKRNLVYKQKTLQIKLPKNNKVREILIPQGLLELLKKHIENTSHKPEDFLFSSERKGYLYPALFYRDYNRIVEKIKKDTGMQLPKSLHAIRHYMISELIASGVPVEVVSQMAGHTSIVITTRIYTHVKTFMQKPVIDMIDNIAKMD